MIGRNQYDTFVQALEAKTKIKLTSHIDEQLDYEETVIKKQFDKNLPKEKKKKKTHISDEFIDAFEELNKTERFELYCTQIQILKNIYDKKLPTASKQPSKKIEVFTPGGAFRSWKRKMIQVCPKDRELILQSQGKVRSHNLSNYIYRKSKNTQYFSFVLECINSQPKSKYKTMHFGFSNINQFNIIYEQVKSSIDYAIALNYASELGISINQNQVNQDLGNSHPTSMEKQIPPPNNMSKSNELQQNKNMAKKDQDIAFFTSEAEKPIIEQEIKFLENQNIKKGQKFKQSNSQHRTTENTVQSKIINKIIQQSVELKNLQQVESEEEVSGQIKPYILQQLLPGYELEDLLDEQGMTTIICEDNHRILQQNENKKHFKIFLTLPSSSNKGFSCVTNPQDIKKWNPQVEDFAIKNVIKCQNTAVIYMKLKNYSAIYRGRDFLFLRHAFREGKNLYIVDKSIQNIDYPPFMTIVRAKFTSVWGFIESKDSNQTLVAIDTTIDNEGILNQQQNTNLALRYLQKVSNLQNFIKEKSIKGDQFAVQLFDLEWITESKDQKSIKKKMSTKLQENQSNVQNNDFKSIIYPKQGNDSFVKPQIKEQQTVVVKENQKSQAISKHPEQQIAKQIIQQQQQKGELDFIRNNQATNLWVPQLDKQGLSIVNWKCLSIKNKLTPWPRPIIIDQNYRQHHYWRGQWKQDRQSGGLWYKDQIKMNAQKKVLGYIVKKMGTNLLKGKGILSISLPVDVFSLESNLQRIARTFTYCPLVLQKVSKIQDPIEQMKQILIIGLTNSLLYLSMQKPFNPVLGQTFQGSVNGCPIFLQQISHHPPIAAYYMVGRGYKIYGSIQSKMQISVNSGCGLNDGNFVIQFENGNIFKFRTPGGQISGLTFGDRKLNLQGKGFYWSPNKQLFLQISYNPNKKGFLSFGKQQTPSDYFEGHIKKVTKQFIQQFQTKKNKIGPNSKDILQQYNKVSGRWTEQLLFDGKVLFNVDRDKYLKFEYEPNPLPSDANYRQDIIYRRLDNIPRSQNQKQKIENIQRQDRKLRQKFTGKGH